MGDNAAPRRGTWRMLLAVDDAAAARRALLTAARQRRAAGAKVVVGSRPPDGDVAELDTMPVVPVRSTPYGHDGIDLDAIRGHRPDVVVIDDLARLTATDAERVPDVDALRQLGIDVISMLRADQIRSLAERMNGSSARHPVTVPDRALLEVDEVEVVAGNSRPDLVALARAWADRPRPRPSTDGGVEYDQPWPGRIVVALDADEDAGTVVARAADLARLTGVRLVGTDVRFAGDDTDAAGRERRRRLLEAVDADFVEVADDDPGWALARIAEAEGAQVVVQRGRIDGPLMLDQQTAGARGLDLYVVAPADAAATDPLLGAKAAPQRAAGLPRRRRLRGLALAVVGVPLLTLVLAGVRGSLDLSTVLLLYLALTVGVTAVGGLGPGLLSALSGFALSVHFFTRPLNRWAIDDPNVIIAVTVFVVAAVLVSVLVDIASRRSAEATRASAEAAALGTIASAILTTRDPLPRLLHDLRAVFGLDGVAILRRSGDDWRVEHAAGSPVPQRPADADDALSIGSGRYLVLSGQRTPADDSRVLAAFTAQLALAVDRRALAEQR